MKSEDPLLNTKQLLTTENINTNNKLGRPKLSTIMKFCPPPKSIISLQFCKEKSIRENCKKAGISFKSHENGAYPNKSFTDSVVNKQDNGEVFQQNEESDSNSFCDPEVDNDKHLTNEHGGFDKECSKTKNIKYGKKGNDRIFHHKKKKSKPVKSQSIDLEKDQSSDVDNSHIEGTILFCNLCSYRCKNTGQLSKHQNLHHTTAPKLFNCDYEGCGYSSKISTNLTKHKRIHTKEKPYSCDLCNFRSNFVSSLKVHKRIHTSERPFCCEHCGYCCNSSSNLKKHCYYRHSNSVYVSQCKPDGKMQEHCSSGN